MKEKVRFLGLDVHAETIAVAIAEPEGEVRSLGTIPNRSESIRKLIKKLGPAEKLRACYEAGPTGYVVYWQLAELGVACEVVAPTLVPVKAGDRVKTDRRDAEKLARCFRSGDLTAVWVPDEGSEALRDLVRAREAAKQDQTRARHRLSKFLLRSGQRPPTGVRPWTRPYLIWVAQLRFNQIAQESTRAQLAAACGEAKALGLRTLIHAHADSAARDASNAGCTSIEHGAFVTDETFRLMAKNGTYYDPNIGLVLQNYIANKEKFLGIGNYNDEGFKDMVEGERIVLDTFKRALEIPGLKIIYGTDAVAGAHGRNADECIARIQQGGQEPMAALISMTSLSATSLGLGDTIGALAPGMEADIVAVDGNLLTDPTAVRRVRFVMKSGKVLLNDLTSPPIAP